MLLELDREIRRKFDELEYKYKKKPKIDKLEKFAREYSKLSRKDKDIIKEFVKKNVIRFPNENFIEFCRYICEAIMNKHENKVMEILRKVDRGSVTIASAIDELKVLTDNYSPKLKNIRLEGVEVFPEELKKKTKTLTCKVYFGEAQNVLLNYVKRESVDLVFTSPPYYTEFYIEKNEWRGFEDYLDEIIDILKKACETLKPGGSLIVNIADTCVNGEHYPVGFKVGDMINEIEEMKYHSTIIWKKPDGSSAPYNTFAKEFIETGCPLKFKPNQNYEYLIVYRKEGEIKEPERLGFRYSEEYIEKIRKYLDSVWKIPPNNKGDLHEFPVELVRRVIELFSVPGDTVLDPCCGTGIVGAVALKLERNAILIEKDTNRREVIRRRVLLDTEFQKPEDFDKIRLYKDKSLTLKWKDKTIEYIEIDNTEYAYISTNLSSSEEIIACKYN